MDTKDMDKMQVKSSLCPSMRLGMVFLWFYGAISMYMIRVNFGISLLCMTIDNTTSSNTTNDSNSCGQLEDESEETGVFYWDRTTRGILNAAVFFGYLTTQLPSGLLAHRFNMKWVHFGGLLIATGLSLLSPLSAEYSEWALFAVRFLVGFCCGSFVSPVRGMISVWSPVQETSTLYGLQSSGYSIGSVLTLSLTGYLCAELGWESTFYIPSMFMVIYLIIFVIFCTDSPEKSRFITDEEREYIVRTRVQLTHQQSTIPWRGIFTSLPCWAIFFSDFAGGWGGYTLLTSGAQYMYDVFKFDIAANGLVNAMPHLAAFVVASISGFLFDGIYSKIKNNISKTNLRKTFEGIAFLTAASTMTALTFLTCQQRGAAIALLCIGMGAGALVNAAALVNALEVAPAIVPVIGGIQNTFGITAGAIAPIVAGVLTPDGTEEQWHRVFYIGAALYGSAAIFYMIFASTDVQPWAIIPNSQSDPITGEKSKYIPAGEWNIAAEIAEDESKTDMDMSEKEKESENYLNIHL